MVHNFEPDHTPFFKYMTLGPLCVSFVLAPPLPLEYLNYW